MQNDIHNNLNNFSFQRVAGLYNIGKTIGKGHFAVVKEACHVITQEKVAIKIIDKTKLDQTSKDQLLSEVMCMKLVQHPNIIRLYEVIDTVNKLYLVLELGDGGDLYDYIINNGSDGLCEEEAKRYFRQILRAIGYCHKLHVVHRDIKPENVVFFKDLELVKLTDFGFSNKFVPGGTLSTSCGSLAYSAPEILLGDSYDAPMVDIWSLGVILFMLVVGSLPFNETNDSETVAKIMDCKYTIPSFVSFPCQNLIKKMLVRDASKRATLDEIINDNWLEINENDAEYELENYSIPLLNQEQLTFEEHIEILTKMSDENLATVDEIQKILDNDEYSHISATYYLLAERKLKRRFVEEYVGLKAKHDSMKIDKDSTQVLDKQKSIVNAQASFDGTRRISMILEGEENEENEAITSLAFVRRELESFLSDNDGNSISGTTARNSSRCISRINSLMDLHSLSDGNESDNGSAVVRPRIRLRSSTIYSNSPRSSRLSEVAMLANDYVFEKDRKSKYLTQYPFMMNPITNKTKSFSVTDISERKVTNISLEFAKNSVHKFSVGSNTARFSSNSAKYMEIRKIALNERRSNQVFFETGSNSTTANCSSGDNSDIEGDVKLKLKNPTRKIEKQISDVLDYRDICEPIHEEDEFLKSRKDMSPLVIKYSSDCFRSQSFDGRLRNNIQLDNASIRELLSMKIKQKSSSSTNSWRRNSLCNHLADSNFSLSSLAHKLENPNMMQVIRGAFELHLHNRPSISDGPGQGKLIPEPKINDNLPPVTDVSTKSFSLFGPKLKPRNIYKHFRTTFPKFKKHKQYIRNSNDTVGKSNFVEHSTITGSSSCHGLSSDRALTVEVIHNSNSIPQILPPLPSHTPLAPPSSPQNTDPHRPENITSTTTELLIKKNHMACCTLS